MTVQDLQNLPKGAVITAGKFNKEIVTLCKEAAFVAIGEGALGTKYEKQY